MTKPEPKIKEPENRKEPAPGGEKHPFQAATESPRSATTPTLPAPARGFGTDWVMISAILGFCSIAIVGMFLGYSSEIPALVIGTIGGAVFRAHILDSK